MPWGRFEDRYPAHRKIRPLSDKAFRLDVTGILWSCEQLTDGLVEDLDDMVGVRNPQKAAAELVRRGRWHLPGHNCKSEECRPIESGWLIHDYFDYNPTAAKVARERELKAARQQRWLNGRRKPRASRDAPGDASSGPSETVTPPRPEGSGAGGRPGRPGRRAGPSGPPAGPVGTWCGDCSDPSRRLEIDSESGQITKNPCPRCGKRRGGNHSEGAA